jgi:hypothetical protein
MRRFSGRFAALLGALWLGVGMLMTWGRITTGGTPPYAGPVLNAAAASGPETMLLVRLGIGDREPTAWDGKITVTPGDVKRIEGWRFMAGDAADGAHFTVSTRRLPMQSSAERERGPDAMPMGDNGFFLTLAGDTPQSKIEIATQQGDLAFTLAELPLGKRLHALDGRVEVVRLPSAAKLVSGPAEEDFPAVAVAGDGSAYVAYIAFTHGEGFAVRPVLNEPPKDFDALTAPTGGDQLLLARYQPGKAGAEGHWEEPIPVTAPGQDLYKPAVAVDRAGRVWVFWSANLDSDGRGEGNWDLMARRYDGKAWSEPIRLTNDAGSDIAPAAATDSDGRVWVVWQAFRGDSSDILARRQHDDQFGPVIVVSGEPGNQWDPAIAASASGQVAFAWDSYANGSYDVLIRVAAGGPLGEPLRVAGSDRYEVRPSLAYDNAGRLWIAWEEAPERWGKDFGALEVDGWPLYRRHTVNLRVLVDGKLHCTKGDLTAALPRPFEGRAGRAAAAKADPAAKPQAKAAAKKKAVPRAAGAHEDRQDIRPPASLPRLAADSSGRVWLAVRARTINTRATVGTIWQEFVSSYNGEEWSPAAMVPLSDALLDNRPAWAAFRDGRLLLVSASDGRHASIQGLAQTGAAAATKPKAKGKGQGQGKAKAKRTAEAVARGRDLVNYDLATAWLPGSTEPARQPALEPAADTAPMAVPGYVAKERDDVRRIREFRTKLGDQTLRIVRGEFHRHTEISGDGGGDGTLQEMWRYGLDAAAMDWIGNGDHDNGNGREYTWWLIQKTSDIFTVESAFTPMYTYERSVGYPDGHRNVVFARRGIRTLPRLQNGLGRAMDDEPAQPRPPTPDTQMLYAYLRAFEGVCASHTSGTNMGTDWRDHDPVAEPFVEIYQGDRQNYEMPGAPRSNTEDYSIGGWRPLGFVSHALQRGHRLAFQASSDHVSTHMSYCNVFVDEPTREAIVRAMRQRRVYGSTDNIIADVRCGEHFMGEEFALDGPPTFTIRLWGTAPFQRIHLIRNNQYVYSAQPLRAEVELRYTDTNPPKGTNYYYVRGEQEDGELVWVSPMWIRNGE